MTSGKIPLHFANRSASMIQLRIIYDNLVTSGIPLRGTAYDDAKSSCAPSWSSVRQSATAPDLLTLGLQIEPLGHSIEIHITVPPISM